MTNEDLKGRYAKWLGLLGVALFPLMAIRLFFGSEMAMDPQRYGLSHFGMNISFLILALTAFAGSFLVMDPYTKLPRWIAGAIIFGSIGYFTAICLCIGTSHNSTLFFAYIPGVTLSLSVFLTFLIQTWVAGEKLGLPLWKVIPVHVWFGGWTFYTLTNSGFTAAFIIVGSLSVCAMVVLAFLTEVTAEDRSAQPPAENQKSRSVFKC